MVTGVEGSSRQTSVTFESRAILELVETVLGLFGLAIFIACTVALAAGITWLVVRFSPNPENKRKKAAAAAEAAGD